MPIELNSLEMERFRIVAARMTDGKASPAAIEEAARIMNVNILTTRVEVSDLARGHALEAGYPAVFFK